MNTGKHIILDAYEIPDEIFINLNNDNYKNFHEYILKNLKENNMTVINYNIKDFENPPGAFTSLYLLSESHLSLHSWPELNFIAIDCFTCGKCDTNKVIEAIISYLQPKHVEKKILERGNKLDMYTKKEVII